MQRIADFRRHCSPGPRSLFTVPFIIIIIICVGLTLDFRVGFYFSHFSRFSSETILSRSNLIIFRRSYADYHPKNCRPSHIIQIITRTRAPVCPRKREGFPAPPTVHVTAFDRIFHCFRLHGRCLQ